MLPNLLIKSIIIYSITFLKFIYYDSNLSNSSFKGDVVRYSIIIYENATYVVKSFGLPKYQFIS